MKKINILYWIFTILISGLMVFTAIPHITADEQSIQFMTGYLGYPKYIIPFIGWAKILGVAAILIPGMPRIKEWAYAGLGLDLIGAIYSIASVPVPAGTPTGQQVFGYVFIGGAFLLLAVSYIYYHKRREASVAITR